MSLLFRRRTVWLPTLWGAALLLALAAVLAATIAFGVTGFLTVQAPARGHDARGARTLVVEGWLDEADLDQALATFRRGRYERVLTTGGPIEAWNEGPTWKTYAERAAGYLTAHGLTGVPVIALPTPATAQERTYLSALKVRDWRQRHADPIDAIDAIDLYSAGVHARRSRLLYRMALGPAVEVGVLAATPHDHDTERWWTSSAAAKTVLGEALAWVWTECCFWPAAPASAEAFRALPKAPD